MSDYTTQERKLMEDARAHDSAKSTVSVVRVGLAMGVVAAAIGFVSELLGFFGRGGVDLGNIAISLAMAGFFIVTYVSVRERDNALSLVKKLLASRVDRSDEPV